MKWFRNLKILVKLLASFIIVALIAGVVGIVGVINLRKIDTEYTTLYKDFGVAVGDVGNVSIAYQRIRVNLRELIIDKGSSERSTYTEKIKGYDKIINDELAEFQKSLHTEEAKNEYSRLVAAINEYQPIKQKIIDLSLSNREEEALKFLRVDGAKLANEINDTIDKLMELKIKGGNERSDEYSVTTDNTVMTMVIVVIFAVLVAVGLGIYVARILSNPVKNMVSAANKLAVGDVNVSVEADTKDEIGELMGAFGRMIKNVREQALAVEKIASGDLTVEVTVKSENDLLGKKLSEMIQKNNEVLININSASEQVAAGSRQVSASSQALSQGATEQASSIEEITSSMTEVAAQTKQNAINANQASELALAVKEKAEQGNDQMKEMVKAMQDINQSSSNISKIIKVIDEIAFQTNILALNAAVEAARAGQHGKGFAVVAEEVRNLAARSANAAKETTDMIEGSIKNVEVGTKIASNTASALSEIVGGVAKAASLVSEIAIASNEQATGISQVNQALEQVAQVVQTNSATAEESAAASEELSGQADLLKESVRRFRLKDMKNTGFDSFNPDVINMIESMMSKKHYLNTVSRGNQENAASVHPKSQISLESNEFGKY
ncbi:MAG: methyl-accepting chemotaxis protein [Clostridia bacterium]|nr:methyl-accepting chemotaxis protein [Clostridia bacterium]